MVSIELCLTEILENDLTFSNFTVLHPKNCKSKSLFRFWGPFSIGSHDGLTHAFA